MSENVKEVRSRTRILVEACNFTWLIENFSFCALKDNESLTSPNFTTGKFLYPAWCLKLHPNKKKKNSETERTIGIYLKRIGAESSYHNVTVEISIIGSDKTKRHAVSLSKTLSAKEDSWGWPEFIDRNVVLETEQLSLLPNDILTVMCELKVTVDDSASEGMEKLISNNSVSLVSLSNSLQHLYESEMCSDLTLKVGNEELNVHKNILCARSSVFNSMLNSKMKENLSSSVEITDFDLPVVKNMLRYIYCGQVEDLTLEMRIQLFSIADKYNLQDLKDTCSKYLLQNLNVGNICAVLVLAEMHNEQELMKAAKRMFCENAAAIQETEPWLELSKKMPHLAFSMYHQLAASQRETK